MGDKICIGPLCKGAERPIDQFNKDKSRRDGLAPYCKGCQSYYHKRRYDTPEGYAVKIEYNRNFYKSDVGKESQRKSYLKNVARYPNKRKARAAVNNAIQHGQMGRVSNFSCVYPGCTKQAKQYHHPSYEEERWLDVLPYCAKHHKAIQ